LKNREQVERSEKIPEKDVNPSLRVKIPQILEWIRGWIEVERVGK